MVLVLGKKMKKEIVISNITQLGPGAFCMQFIADGKQECTHLSVISSDAIMHWRDIYYRGYAIGIIR